MRVFAIIFLREVNRPVGRCNGGQPLLSLAVCERKEVSADEEESNSAFYLCGHRTVHFLRRSAMTARLAPSGHHDFIW